MARRPRSKFSRFPTMRRDVDPRLLALTVPDPSAPQVEGEESPPRRAHRSSSALHHAHPYLRVAPALLAVQSLDPRCGFLLPHLDGDRSVHEIAAACLLPEVEVFELLWGLLERRIVALTTRPTPADERR